MSLLRYFFCGQRIHHVFEQKQLLVKVIDGGAFAVLVLFKSSMHLRRGLGIVHRSVLVAAVGEGAPNADGANGVESVGVLHDEAFETFHFIFHARAFVGNVYDDFAHFVSGGNLHAAGIKPGFGAKRGFIAHVVEFPVVEVVQESGKFTMNASAFSCWQMVTAFFHTR